MVYGLGSREDALSMRREKELRINVKRLNILSTCREIW
jgi:hypothetical protein